MEVTRGRVQANGVSFTYLEAGRGPLALCLHGFPDNAHTYDATGPHLQTKENWSQGVKRLKPRILQRIIDQYK